MLQNSITTIKRISAIMLLLAMFVSVSPEFAVEKTYAAKKGVKSTWGRIKKIKKSVKNGTVKFTIKKIKGARKYKIYIKRGKSGWEFFKTQKSRKFNIVVEPGMKYKFRVKAVGKNLAKKPHKAYSVDMRTKAQKVPKKPTKLKAIYFNRVTQLDCDYETDIGDNQVVFGGFKSKSDTTKYEIQVKTPSTDWKTVKYITKTQINEYPSVKLAASVTVKTAGTYSFKARGINKYGEGPWSETKTCKVEKWQIIPAKFEYKNTDRNVNEYLKKISAAKYKELFWYSFDRMHDYEGSLLSAREQVAYINKVKNLAAELTKNCSTDLEKAEAFRDWFVANVVYKKDQWWTYRYFMIVDDPGKGYQCAGQARFYADLCRAAGIPALLYHHYIDGIRSHLSLVAYIDGEWKYIDPTFKESMIRTAEECFSGTETYIKAITNY